MDIINIQAMKGGTGTTTISVALATLINDNTNLRIGVHTNKNHDDLTAAAGVSRGTDIQSENVTYRPTTLNLGFEDRFDVVIVDNGYIESQPLTEPNPYGNTHNIYIVRADYLSLRRSVSIPRDSLDPKAIWIARTNAGGALSARDVRDVIGLDNNKVIDIPDDPTIARAVDAGVLRHRVPAPFVAIYDAIINSLNLKESA